MIRFGEKLQVVPLLSPVDITETATSSNFVKLNNAHWVSFLVFFGTITGDSVDVYVEASTTGADSDTETAIPFRYRLSGVVGTDTLGAITSGSSAGLGIAAGDDDKLLLIDVDPASIQSHLTAADFLRVRIVPGSSSVSACEVSVVGVIEPRYPSNAQLSSS